MTGSELSKPTSSRFPLWLLFSLLTVVAWGLWGIQSKIAVDRISPWTNQVLFPLGLLPVLLWCLRSRNLRKVAGSSKRGALFSLLTGVLGGAGNVAYFLALSRGGLASTVTPLVGLAPLATVILAFAFLGEKLNVSQLAGLVLALAAIYLLST